MLEVLHCRLDRLQALQKTFDDQLNSLEETHSEQKANSQQLLEKDMNNLRKKVLAENVSGNNM